MRLNSHRVQRINTVGADRAQVSQVVAKVEDVRELITGTEPAQRG